MLRVRFNLFPISIAFLGIVCFLVPAAAQESTSTTEPQSAASTTPPTGARGVVAGTIFDGNTAQPVRQAVIEVVDHPQWKAVSDTDGRYELRLDAGTYTLRITAPQYLTATLEGVVVSGGKTTEGSTVMALATSVTTVDVQERISAVAASSEAAITERRLAPVVSDAISGEEMRKTTASDAAGALQKVTGVTVAEGGYVFVRGLGERYSATMLNNAMLPTTEPERRVVPLDLFPSTLLDNISVLKSYTPDLPGEFSGGLVQMKTVEFPTQRTLRVSANIGFNTNTTFNSFRSYKGGSTDFFGFDDGTRSLPTAIPTNARLFAGSFTSSEFQAFGRAFSDNWQTDVIDSMRPQMSYSVVAGDTFGRLGLVGAVTFTNKPQRLDELQNYYTNGGSGPTLLTSYPNFESDNENARIGAILNAAIRLTSSHKLVFRNTYTHDTDKEGRVFSGLNGGIDVDIVAERLRWVERSLYSTSVEGEHSFTSLGNTLFRWQLTYSRSTRDEPDMREVIRGQVEGSDPKFLALGSSGTRFFNNLEDHIYEPLAEITKPFYIGNVGGVFRFGFRGTFRDRDFEARRFRYTLIRPDTVDLSLPSDELLSADNIRSDGFVLRENTRSTDQYNAGMDVYAGFAMVDLALTSRWRLIAGARVEDAQIDVNTIDPYVPNASPVVAGLYNRDFLPAVNVVYALRPRQNLRFAYGRTVSRPDFRELSPFDFTNVLGGFDVVGNADLKRALIDNFDGRWEWFISGEQLLAASVFYKHFKDPVEMTLQPTTSDLRQSFLNAESARNYGVEIEARKNLGWINRKLSQLSIYSNFTFVDSNVKIPDSQKNILTTLSRPLMGQSRFVFNFSTEWTKPTWRSNARFYLTYASRRLDQAGALGLPDVYQEANTFLDFVYEYSLLENGRWNIRFSGENLGDNHYLWTQGDLTQRSYHMGRTFSIGTSFSIF